MTRFRRALAALVVLTIAVPVASHAEEPAGQVFAGAASVDSTWHVGASSGQYAGDEPGPVDLSGSRVEPYQHSWISRPSYGLQGRESVRALVVQGSDGKRIALVTNNLYIPQDLLDRRVAGLLAKHDALIDAGLASGPKTGIDGTNLAISVSHSHSSPYYSTPAWGPWAFQDVFDIRFYEFFAQKMADAIITAASHMVPARIGGSVSYFDLLGRHSFGPTVADDGTPAGYPHADFPATRNVAGTENERMVFVVAVDDISGERPKPLATWAVLGQHPEMLSGNDLLASEYVNTMFRNVDREIGGVTLFSQENTGTVEPAKDAQSLPPYARAEYSHREYAQVERAGRYLADAVEKTRRDIANGTPEDSNQFSAFASAFPVKMTDVRFAPPNLRPTQTVSNCRTERYFQGDPGVPVIGLPDCDYTAGDILQQVVAQSPVSPRVVYDQLRAAGVPVPSNIGFPSAVALQETPQVHLQAIRLGAIGITVCPCEQWGDQAHNIRTRLNKTAGDLWDGFDWTRHSPDGDPSRKWCTHNADTTWTCYDPRFWHWSSNEPGAHQIWDHLLPPVSDNAYQRMIAQIHNDAAGWDELTNLNAETDPAEPKDIKGNFTHEELTQYGYDLVIPIGMTNDYMGYLASYREFERGDHYRKALTGLGPHSEDFMATRLSRMAANLNGAAFSLLNPKDVVYGPEDQREYTTAQAIGEVADAMLPAYEATLPPDGGTAGITAQPANITRFSAATVKWTGGDTYTDLPDVRVERLVDGSWQPYANGLGEVQYRTWFPGAADMPGWRAGSFEWKWQATFEAFGSDISLVDATGAHSRATPAGTYRFQIAGTRRGLAGAKTAYAFASDPFEVAPWNGITVQDMRVDEDGAVSFVVPAIDYPDSYNSPFPFIAANRETYAGEPFCLRCSFRPWADTGTATAAKVFISRTNDEFEEVDATLGNDGRWHTAATLSPGDRARVQSGGVTDAFGDTNADGSSVAA